MMEKVNTKYFVLLFISVLFIIIRIYLNKRFGGGGQIIFAPPPIRTQHKPPAQPPPQILARPPAQPPAQPTPVHSITKIEGSVHLAVSAFVDHRVEDAIRVISILKRAEVQSLYCIYGDGKNESGWRVSKAEVEIHSDHFGFPFATSDLLCRGNGTREAALVRVTTDAGARGVTNGNGLLVLGNRAAKKTFKFEFTVCVSNLFGNYNNVLQVAQTLEMYKLLGVQHVVVYNTSCGPDLDKLLRHYEEEGFLEIVPWPIDRFLKPSPGWNFSEHGGDLHYYGQLATLNECIYRNMYRSRYVLLNDLDEIIMPYKHPDLPSLMDELQREHRDVGVFYIENHIFPKTLFEKSHRFHRPEWASVSGINLMEHVYREPDRKDVYNPKKMIIDPRKVFQTSVHSVLKNMGGAYLVPNDVCRIVHVRTPLQAGLPEEKLFVDTRVWDFEEDLVPNVTSALRSSGLL